MKHPGKAAATLTLAVLLAIPASAHHAFSSEFDVNKPIHLTGTVTRFEFVNPHAWLRLAVKSENGNTPGGETEDWMIETGSPNRLLGRGITKLSLPVGTQVIVDGYASKDGTLKATGQQLTLPDGRRLFISGTRPPR